MSNPNSAVNDALGLRAGEWVEVRRPEEILATLDARGSLDALPFMPEMLQYSGRRFRVSKTAHKTCDTIEQSVNRRMNNAVHLEGLRCDGEAHGGCQAGCLLFWKKAWLKRVPGPEISNSTIHSEVASGADTVTKSVWGAADFEVLARATRPPGATVEAGMERYSCQATEMHRATTPLRWWDPRQYAMDLLSRNVKLRDFVRTVVIAMFNSVQRRLGGRTYPYVRGLADGKTPTAELNLQAGELVRVRSKEEIMRTINANRRNRGLSFDVEMVPYCGKTFRVLRRVEKTINEKTGDMIHLPNPCLILEGVTCSGCLSRNRLFCQRSIYPYWREIWLKRVEQ